MPPFSDVDGTRPLTRDQLTADAGWTDATEWYVHKSSDTDEEGWKYSMAFIGNEFTAQQNQIHTVRKRIWMKKLTKEA